MKEVSLEKNKINDFSLAVKCPFCKQDVSITVNLETNKALPLYCNLKDFKKPHIEENTVSHIKFLQEIKDIQCDNCGKYIGNLSFDYNP
jgi:hypothetical protein